MNKIERFLNNNMWWISFWLILIVFFIFLIPYIPLPVCPLISYIFWIREINKTIDLQFTITTIWAIIAFWYWYRKYERDKDIQHLENLSNDIYSTDIENKFYKFELIYSYHKKLIISDEIWLFIEKHFWLNFHTAFDEYLKKQAFIHSIDTTDSEHYYNIMYDIIAKKYLSLIDSNDKDYINYIIIKLEEQITMSKNRLFINITKAVIKVFTETT